MSVQEKLKRVGIDLPVLLREYLEEVYDIEF